MRLTKEQERQILGFASKAKREVIKLFRGTGLASEEKEPIGADVAEVVEKHLTRIMTERMRPY